jgi:hypothetical protein
MEKQFKHIDTSRGHTVITDDKFTKYLIEKINFMDEYRGYDRDSLYGLLVKECMNRDSNHKKPEPGRLSVTVYVMTMRDLEKHMEIYIDTFAQWLSGTARPVFRSIIKKILAGKREQFMIAFKEELCSDTKS